MITALVTLIIYLIILGLLYWLVLAVLDAVPLPDPFAKIVRIALLAIMVLVVIMLLLNLIGVSTGLELPRLNA
jgi:hypothetical protein